jgi:hypothetical protein
MHHGTEVKLPKTLAVAVKEGIQGISIFFPSKRKPGRPKTTMETPEETEHINSSQELPEAAKQAIAGTTRAMQGLNTFLLKPDALKGVVLFDHMINIRMGSFAQPFSLFVHLDIHVCANHGHHILHISTQLDLSIRKLMKDAGGDGGTLRLVQRKIDNLLTYIEGKSGLANDDERLSS